MVTNGDVESFPTRIKRFHAHYEETRVDRANSMLAQALFYVPLGVWIAVKIGWSSCFAALATQVLPISDITFIINCIRWACLAALAVHELFYGRHDRRSLVGFVVAAIMAAIVVRFNYTNMFDGIWFVFAARDISFKQIARFVIVEIAVLIAVIVASALAGIIDDAEFGEGSERGIRHALGFSSPNTAPAYSIFIFCLWAYLRGERFGLVDAFAIALIGCALYMLTRSRTALILTILLVVLMVSYRYIPILQHQRSKNIIGRIVIWSVLVAAVLSILLCAMYDPDVAWMEKLNRIVSHRLSYGHAALEQFGFSLLGQSVSNGVTAQYNRFTGEINLHPPGIIIDNLYIRVLVYCGPVFLAMGLAITMAALTELHHRGEIITLLILAIPILYSLMETIPYTLHFNPFLFLLAVPLACKLEASKEESSA